MKIAIPTYRRPTRLLTLELANAIVGVENVFVFFHDNQDLLNYKNNYEILNAVVTNNIPGISRQRNAILNNFLIDEEIIMLDDDITCFYKLIDGKLKTLTPEETKIEFENCFKELRKQNAKLFGIYPIDNEYFMSNKIDEEAILQGTCLGVINNLLRFDENLTSKEDYDYSLQNIKEFGKVLRFNYLSCKAKHKQKSLDAGGCAWVYKDNWEKDFKALLEKWRDVIKVNPKRPNEVLIKKNIGWVIKTNQGRLI